MKPITYCKRCGAYIPDGNEKCVACGMLIDGVPLSEMDGAKLKKKIPIKRKDIKDISDYLDQRERELSESNIRKARELLWQPEAELRNGPDLDIDKLMQKEFLTVKINGEISTFYLGDGNINVTLESLLQFRGFSGSSDSVAIKRNILIRLIER